VATGGSGQIDQPRLVFRTEAPGQIHPAQSRERPDLRFVADDDGARAVGCGAERERVLGMQPPRIRDEGESTRSV